MSNKIVQSAQSGEQKRMPKTIAIETEINASRPLIIIDIAEVVLEKLSIDGVFDVVDRSEYVELLRALPSRQHLDIEAAFTDYAVRLAEYAFLIGWQLAKK